MNDDTADIRTATDVAEAGAEQAPVRKKARKKRAKSSTKTSAKSAANAATSAIEERIGHKFADANLLVTAETCVIAVTRRLASANLCPMRSSIAEVAAFAADLADVLAADLARFFFAFLRAGAGSASTSAASVTVRMSAVSSFIARF